MKDSFGSAYMIYIFIFFVIIFITFISLILKYAQAFKVKDNIISIIEEYEGYTNSYEAIDYIEEYIENNTSYRPEDLSASTLSKRVGDKCSSTYKFCVGEHSDNSGRKYYTVYTFVTWNFPFLGLGGTWEIQGETRPVVSNVVSDYK